MGSCWMHGFSQFLFSLLPLTERAGSRVGCSDWPVVVEEEQDSNREERAAGGAGGAYQGGGEALAASAGAAVCRGLGAVGTAEESDARTGSCWEKPSPDTEGRLSAISSDHLSLLTIRTGWPKLDLPSCGR